MMKSTLLALALAAVAPGRTQNAIANGDTRTISLYHSHTGESISATFRVNGSYDTATLEKLNWFLRDWRRDEPTKMDPRLFDAIWETYRESGSQMPIVIVSAYRSPETNAMLRRRSRAVAEFSQHMLGKAMDMHYQDVPMSRVREIAMHLQRGGVGYYPTAGSPFVHMDVGSVRAWPRMSYEQLARLFPDGKTVHLPSNGHPLARYEEARAEVEARNGVSVPSVAQVQSKGFFASLFGGGEDDAPAPSRGGVRVGGDPRVAGFIDRSRGSNAATRMVSARPAGAPSSAIGDENSTAAFFVADAARQSPPARAQLAAPAPAPQVAAVAPPPQKPTVIPEPAPQPAPVATRPAPEPVVEVKVADAPLPPRRPAELLAMVVPVAANVPLPPVRPAGLTDGGSPRPPTRTAELPSAIPTGGAAPVAASAAGALAYAPAPPVIGAEPSRPVIRSAPVKTAALASAPSFGARAIGAVRHNDDQAARLDRSNFRQLTAPAELTRSAPAAVAPVMAGLRRASRSDLSDLVFAPPSGVAIGFTPGGANREASEFSGQAVRPLPRMDRAALSADPSANRVN